MDSPEEDYTEGPAVAVEILAAEPPKKRSLWWVWVLVAVIVVVVAVVLFLVLRKPKPPEPKPPEPAASQPVPPEPRPPVTREFNDPRVAMPQGNLALDVCREWGQNCGKPAADAFCVSQGFLQATDFRIASDSPPTVVIGSKQVCDQQFCDRISWIQCTGQRGVRATLDPNTQLYLQSMHKRGKQGPVPASSP